MKNISTFKLPNFKSISFFFWPIYKHELKKIIPMISLFFIISFVYKLLRSMKISLIVSASNSCVEVVPFLKVGAVLPAALFFTYIFTSLNRKYNRDVVFYSIVLGFLAYFVLFMFVLYPFREFLELNTLADFLQETLLSKDGFKGLVAVIRHWNLSLFYVFCEMWSVVVLSLLFWGFANQVTKVNEAKRFYAIFTIGANISGVFTGIFAKFTNTAASIPVPFYDHNNSWIFYQIFIIIILGLVIVGIYNWLSKNVFQYEKEGPLKVKKKSTISLSKSFSYLFSSKYLLCILTIVVSYNLVFNLSDVMWTYKVKQVCQTERDINTYMNLVELFTGIVATFCAFVIASNFVRYYGWLVAALVTPIVWAITSMGFFGGLIFEKIMLVDLFYSFMGNPINMVLLLGTLQVCLGRGCKFTIFDKTKELTFLPLSNENKIKAKAVVDGVASRFGKSGGSLLYVLLLMLLGDISSTIPYATLIIFVAIALWIFAIFVLGKMVKTSIDDEKIEQNEIEQLDKDSRDKTQVSDEDLEDQGVVV